jgi:hypothetical protein
VGDQRRRNVFAIVSWTNDAGVPDERLGIARVGLEHFEAAVAGHVSDLEQVRARFTALVTKPARRLWPA